MKKMLRVLKSNWVVIVSLLLFVFTCFIIKYNYMDVVQKLDNNVREFFATKVISDSLTPFMKDVTYLGSTISVIVVFLMCLFLFKDKISKIIMSLDLTLLLFLRWSLKNTFRRPRPEYALTIIPKDFSFPSGHTLFSVGFYGLIIYFIWKTNIEKLYKYILSFIIGFIVVLISISRIYLNVHYFTDVLAGFIFGVLSIILIIGIYKSCDWKWIK